MKVVLIIYAVSFLILFVYYVNLKFCKKYTGSLFDFSDKPWIARIGFWVFSPAVVLFLPYRLYVINKGNKEPDENELWQAAEEEEVELSEQYELERDNISQGYESALLADDFIISAEILKKGKEIQFLAENKRYSAFMRCLDKLSLLQPYSLKVVRDRVRCKLCIFDGEKYDDDIWKYIKVEDSYMGAWQAFLLQGLWNFLPGRRAKSSYIYSINDFERIKAAKCNLLPKFNSITRSDVAPKIVKKDDKYYVSCCFFTGWGGLIREVVVITIHNHKVDNISEFWYKTLIHYDCGIMF